MNPRDEIRLNKGHVGKKTRQVLEQEMFSMLNTKKAFRKPDWQETFKSLINEYLLLE
jgi:hypothetical protein